MQGPLLFIAANGSGLEFFIFRGTTPTRLKGGMK